METSLILKKKGGGGYRVYDVTPVPKRYKKNLKVRGGGGWDKKKPFQKRGYVLAEKATSKSYHPKKTSNTGKEEVIGGVFIISSVLLNLFTRLGLEEGPSRGGDGQS